jgi:hypothetical protein
MDLRQFYSVIEATKPEKLAPLSTEQLEKYCEYLPEVRSDISLVNLCTDRMALIRKEIELRRFEARSDRQHREVIELGDQTFRVGHQTLRWTRLLP